MDNKILEIRDRATFIPVIAVKMKSTDDLERYYLNRSGFIGGKSILLVRLIDNKCAYDPYDWACSPRTMQVAHIFIEKHYDELATGDVVDVEHILSESPKKKVSERFE